MVKEFLKTIINIRLIIPIRYKKIRLINHIIGGEIRPIMDCVGFCGN